MNKKLYARCLRHFVREPSCWIPPVLSCYWSYLKLAFRWYIAVPPFGFLSILFLYALFQLLGMDRTLPAHLPSSFSFVLMMTWPLASAVLAGTLALPVNCARLLWKVLSSPYACLLSRCERAAGSSFKTARKIESLAHQIETCNSLYQSLQLRPETTEQRESLIQLYLRTRAHSKMLESQLDWFEPKAHSVFEDIELCGALLTEQEQIDKFRSVLTNCTFCFRTISAAKQRLREAEQWLTARCDIAVECDFTSVAPEPPEIEELSPETDLDFASAREARLHALGISDEQLFAHQ